MTLFDAIRVPHLRDGFIVAKVGQAIFALAGPILIATLWQGFVLAATTALFLRLTPRTSATLRFILWTAVLLLICLLPLASTAPATQGALHADPHWSLALAALWLSFSLYRAADLVSHAVRLRALSRQATPVILGSELAALLQTNRGAHLCTSTALDRPGVLGFFRPRILIPAWLFDQLTAPELEQIVLHELEHLRRRDDWLNLLQKLSLVAFPLNPALYWIERQLCRERELACDEGVVRRTHAPRLYATCLARLAEHGLARNSGASRALSLALSFLERQSELACRVASILRAPRTLSPRQNLALTGAMAALLLGSSVELARCPQFISFTPVSLAANSGAPPLAPETWVSRPSATPVLYTGASKPHLLHATLRQVRKPLRKNKNRRAPTPAATQRAFTGQAVPAEFLATGTGQPAPTATQVAPTLVRYTLVPVEGGWLLLQL